LPNLLKEGIYKYNDKAKRFLKRTLEKVEYFRDIGQDAIHDVLYGLKGAKYEPGDILQEPGDDATKLFILQSGLVEVYTSFEEYEFSLSKLFKGSILNYRTFFMENEGKVYIRFLKQSILQMLSIDQMEELCTKHQVMAEKFYKFQKSILLSNKSFPLDYIINLPKSIRNSNLTF